MEFPTNSLQWTGACQTSTFSTLRELTDGLGNHWLCGCSFWLPRFASYKRLAL